LSQSCRKELDILNPQEWDVLIVEDEFDSLQTLSIILKHYGIQIHVSHNGKECLNMLETLHPTAIVMDLAMPEMDGWETLTEIRANHRISHIPVIAVTAFYSVDVAEDAMRAGFDGYFPKPVSPTHFVEQLGQIIHSTLS
jgi:CheY-like chemotaxis protein